MALKSFRELSPQYRARIRRAASAAGMNVRAYRAAQRRDPALGQRARGHVAPAGTTEHRARAEKEAYQAQVFERLTSDEVQQIRRWFVRRAVDMGFEASEGEASYKAAIGAFRNLPFHRWEEVRDTIDENNTGTMYYKFGEPRAGEDIVNANLIGFIESEFGIDLEGVNLFPVYKPNKYRMAA